MQPENSSQIENRFSSDQSPTQFINISIRGKTFHFSNIKANLMKLITIFLLVENSALENLSWENYCLLTLFTVKMSPFTLLPYFCYLTKGFPLFRPRNEVFFNVSFYLLCY